ncbi:TPA_asm: AMP-binding protein [Salmonella enterica subsp. diarizonae]|nr:AMP-binding protein [Salmonella enterica subsp. diarizonae]
MKINNIVDFPAAMTLVSLFEEQVRKTPDEVALVSDEMTLTLQELNTLANRLPEPLREHGVTAGSVVGLCMQRSAMAIATLLSILKSGAAYLPISTEAPAERRAFMLRDSQAILVVADDAQLVHFATTDVMVLSGKALAAAAQTAVDTRPSSCDVFRCGVGSLYLWIDRATKRRAR